MFRFKLLLFLIAIWINVSTSLHCHSQQGLWDAQLHCPGGPIRFGLKLDQAEKDGEWTGWLINGEEQIKVPKVTSLNDGKLVLSIEHYDSELTLSQVAKSESSTPQLNGSWRKRRSANKWVELSFEAFPTKAEKKNRIKNPSHFDGRWQVNFSSSDEPAIGIFKTNSKTGKLGGTFLTTTGDYRFLSGAYDDSSMEISCFDGAHAFLFKAALQKNGTLVGDFWSSKSWHETWTATRDEDANLPDGFELTKATESNINTLAFPDLDGKQTRLDADKFAAPVRIVHIFGSWCPNCHDAAVYLSALESKYEQDISVVGIAFELTGDFKRDAEQVRKYLKRNQLNHPVLIGGGSSSKDKASEAISVIDKVRSYPTTVFADRDGNIVAVHQGFSGPATGEAYTRLKNKFESTIEKILRSQK